MFGTFDNKSLFAFKELAKFEEMEEKVVLSERGAILFIKLIEYI